MLYYATIRVPIAALDIDAATVTANKLTNDINVSPGTPRAEVVGVADSSAGEIGVLYKAMCQRIDSSESRA